jgi:hypothetical protein
MSVSGVWVNCVFLYNPAVSGMSLTVSVLYGFSSGKNFFAFLLEQTWGIFSLLTVLISETVKLMVWILRWTENGMQLKKKVIMTLILLQSGTSIFWPHP